MGSATVIIDGLAIAKIPLIAAEDVPEWGLLPALRRLIGNWSF